MGGIFDKPDQSVHLVMLGLDSAGKSTILYQLKNDQFLTQEPTVGFNCEEVKGKFGKAKGVNFMLWDVGGQDKVRPLWKTYTSSTDGILFVIDSSDTDRMAEAKRELSKTASLSETAGVPILVVANKQDLPGANEPISIESKLGVNGMAGSGRLTSVCGTSAKTGEGLQEALESLYQMIIQKRKSCTQVKNKW